MQYVEQGETQKLHLRNKCEKRKPWYVVTDRSNPDAFLMYMSWYGPKIILNRSSADCTNAIHRIYFKDKNIDPKSIALGILSSIAQYHIELKGRTYGGGVLKLEPGIANIIWIPIIDKDVDRLFQVVNKLIIRRRDTLATRLIDNSISERYNIYSEMKEIRRELSEIRKKRMQKTKS